MLRTRISPADSGSRATSSRAKSLARRGHGDLPQIRAEPHGNHVTLDHFTDADRRIVTSGDDVNDFIAQGDIEHDVRTGFIE